MTFSFTTVGVPSSISCVVESAQDPARVRLTPWRALLEPGTGGEIGVGDEVGIRVLCWRVGQAEPPEILETALQGALLARGTEGEARASHSSPADASRAPVCAPGTLRCPLLPACRALGRFSPLLSAIELLIV